MRHIYMVGKVCDKPESNNLTEEAKKELEELGEDTSDYVVATKAKKQQIIKDYTAVASNGGKGVDILDANGNYKNMFEIMNEIGSIYAELQAEDKKYGENRSMALIEELAKTKPKCTEMCIKVQI